MSVTLSTDRFPCPACETDAVVYHGLNDGYECQQCGQQWSNERSATDLFDAVVETDTVWLGAEEVVGTVVYVAPDRSELTVKTDTGIRYQVRPAVTGTDGDVIITDRQVGSQYHADYLQFDTGDSVSMRLRNLPESGSAKSSLPEDRL